MVLEGYSAGWPAAVHPQASCTSKLQSVLNFVCPAALRPQASCPSKLQFVLKEGEAWLTDLGNDFTVDLQPARELQGWGWVG